MKRYRSNISMVGEEIYLPEDIEPLLEWMKAFVHKGEFDKYLSRKGWTFHSGVWWRSKVDECIGPHSWDNAMRIELKNILEEK